MKILFTSILALSLSLTYGASSNKKIESESSLTNRKLLYVVIPEWKIDKEPLIDTFQKLQILYRDLNPAKENLSIALDIGLIKDSDLLQRKVSIRFKDVPTSEVIRLLAELNGLHYDIQGSTIVIFKGKAQQDAAANP